MSSKRKRKYARRNTNTLTPNKFSTPNPKRIKTNNIQTPIHHASNSYRTSTISYANKSKLNINVTHTQDSDTTFNSTSIASHIQVKPTKPPLSSQKMTKKHTRINKTFMCPISNDCNINNNFLTSAQFRKHINVHIANGERMPESLYTHYGGAICKDCNKYFLNISRHTACNKINKSTANNTESNAQNFNSDCRDCSSTNPMTDHLKPQNIQNKLDLLASQNNTSTTVTVSDNDTDDDDVDLPSFTVFPR